MAFDGAETDAMVGAVRSMITVAAAVLLEGAVCEDVFETAFAAIVRMTVPSEQPVSWIV